MFTFFFESYRKHILDFCGVEVRVTFDPNGSDGKIGFKEFENGLYKLKDPVSRHPNILKGVITGKKGWGLWVEQWSQGIVEGTFTKREIIEVFSNKGIEIPDPLLKEWNNLIIRKITTKINKHNENT